jgi:hypothetical protein
VIGRDLEKCGNKGSIRGREGEREREREREAETGAAHGESLK